MPQYIPAPEIEYYPDIPHGTLRDTTFSGTYLNNCRTSRVYTPPGYESSSEARIDNALELFFPADTTQREYYKGEVDGNSLKMC